MPGGQGTPSSGLQRDDWHHVGRGVEFDADVLENWHQLHQKRVPRLLTLPDVKDAQASVLAEHGVNLHSRLVDASFFQTTTALVVHRLGHVLGRYIYSNHSIRLSSHVLPTLS